MADPAATSSWIDRLVGPETRRRGPSWTTVLLVWGAGVAVVLVVFALAGENAAERRTYELLSTFYAPFGLLAYRWVMTRMGRAFDAFRPALTEDADHLASRRRRLTAMPAGAAAAAAGIGALAGSAAAVAEPFVGTLFARSPVAAVLLAGVNYAWNTAVVTTALVQVVRVMGDIARVHREADAIDIFVTAPNRAFAPVTATVGVLLVFAGSYSVATAPERLDNPVWTVVAISCLVLAVITFVTPLIGLRHRLHDQRERLQQSSMHRIRKAAVALETAFDNGHHDEVERLKTTLEALDRERQRISDASTWPWERRTLRGFVSTLLLPIVVWFVTSLLGRTLGI